MIDVNGVFDYQGKFICLGIFERKFDPKYPSEISVQYPAKLSKKDERYACKITEKALKAININFGPVKSDLIFYKKKFYVLEVSNRLHGPKSFELYNMLECNNHLLNVIEIYKNKSIKLKEFKSIAACYSIKPKNKKLKKLIINKNSIFTKYYNKFKYKKNYLNNTDIIGNIFIKDLNISQINKRMKKFIDYI